MTTKISVEQHCELCGEATKLSRHRLHTYCATIESIRPNYAIIPPTARKGGRRND